MTDLPTALADLASAVDWAEPTDLVDAVRARVEAPAPHRTRRRVALAVAGVAAAAGIALSPAGPALADLIGLRDVVVKVVDDLPPAAAEPDLGQPVTLADARATVEFPIRRPPLLGPPDGVYVGSPPGGVTLRWRSPDVLVTQHPGELAGVVKTVVERSRALPVDVDGHAGLWLTGPHVVTYVAPDGTVVAEPPRQARNTLVWSEDGIITRLEVDGPLRGALDLARSLPS
jgi:hypothetical protein